MSEFDDILDQLLHDGSDERFLNVARFAERGMSAAAVIHEIRQPLAALKMALQMTQEAAGNANASVLQGLKESLSLASRTEELLERARDFMSPTSDDSPIDLPTSISKIVSVFHWQIRNRDRILLKTQISPQMATLYGDRSQVEQMVANLISNSLDAVRDVGQGTIWVIARQTGQRSIEIIVADNGSGVEQALVQKIFEPFYSTKDKAHGTGLGLFIASKFAQKHGGTCKLMTSQELSAVGDGGSSTGFKIEIPVSKETHGVR